MNTPLIVKDCQSYIIDVPLKRPHVMSFGAVREVNYVLIRIETQEGLVGWGEAATFHGPTWSEESAESIKATIDNFFIPRLKNKSLLEYRTALSYVFAPYQGNNFARAAVEFAVLDLAGQYYNQPICVLLGGKYRESVKLSWSLASGSMEEDVIEAREKYNQGYRIFKFKFGAESWRKDLARLEAVRAELDDKVSLRIDVNQGWDFTTARKVLTSLEAAGVDLIEQPLPKWDLRGIAAIRSKTSIPIMADESLCSEHAAFGMVRDGCVDIFAYKLTKLGGLQKAVNTYHMARMAGITTYIGCMIETSLGTAAYLQFAAMLSELKWGCELWGPEMLKDDVVGDPIIIKNGEVHIPHGPGLGVKVDIDKIRFYQRKN